MLCLGLGLGSLLLLLRLHCCNFDFRVDIKAAPVDSAPDALGRKFAFVFLGAAIVAILRDLVGRHQRPSAGVRGVDRVEFSVGSVLEQG